MISNISSTVLALDLGKLQLSFILSKLCTKTLKTFLTKEIVGRTFANANTHLWIYFSLFAILSSVSKKALKTFCILQNTVLVLKHNNCMANSQLYNCNINTQFCNKTPSSTKALQHTHTQEAACFTKPSGSPLSLPPPHKQYPSLVVAEKREH